MRKSFIYYLLGCTYIVTCGLHVDTGGWAWAVSDFFLSILFMALGTQVDKEEEEADE
jgi:hypothetical protein